MENIAVTLTGRFWSDGDFTHRRREYEKARGGLQQAGTESAHRTVEQMGDWESRWVEDYAVIPTAGLSVADKHSTVSTSVSATLLISHG